LPVLIPACAKQALTNSDPADLFLATVSQKNRQDVTCFTRELAAAALNPRHGRKNPQSPSDRDADIRADYALIAAASGAALFALIYLILI
jgi:hypothetical protein